MSFTVENIRQIKVPVTDLQCSVDWYRQLLGLELHREFVEGGRLVGAVLRHQTGGSLSASGCVPQFRVNPVFPDSTCSALGSAALATYSS
jgi:catechol 2,3-dioxygenase-like lactoylglutathione lyase family enzyme